MITALGYMLVGLCFAAVFALPVVDVVEHFRRRRDG